MIEPMATVSSLLGALLALVMLVDIFLTLTHQDWEGPVTGWVQRTIGNTMYGLSGRLGRYRRAALTFMGPLVLGGTFVTWTGLYLLSFALIIWPRLMTGYHFTGPPLGLGFIDALYVSGVMASTLGLGDVVPTTTTTKLLAIAQSGGGFALVSAVVSHLLGVSGSLADRDEATLTVFEEFTEASGPSQVAEALRTGETAALCRRLERACDVMRTLFVKTRQYTAIYLYYRAADPQLDPEPMLRRLADLAMAASLAPSAALAVDGRRLSDLLTRLAKVIGEQYLSRAAAEAMARPVPAAADRERLARVIAEMRADAAVVPDADAERAALELTCRVRLVLEGLEAITRWTHDHAHDPLATASDPAA